MTAEEFLKKRYPAGLPISTQQWEDDMPEIMQAYAEHLDQTAWVTDGSLPPLIKGKDCSENVFAIVEGFSEIQVMNINYLIVGESSEDMGFLWANCYGEIHGDGEIDGDYKITAWRPIPTPPSK